MKNVVQNVIDGMSIPNATSSNGVEISCHCPFHSEQNKSFFINVDMETYHCFGCHAKGSLTNLVMTVCKVGFFKATALLRSWGVEEVNGVNIKIEPIKESDYRKFNAKGWEDYLKNRKFDTTFVKKFGVRYDKVHNALVIPIRNKDWKLVGMKFRKLVGKDFWYTKGFAKSKYLFGEVRINEKKRLFVVEGELDAIKVQQYGYPAVAIMGTALSKSQEKLLSEYKTIVLCMDNDEAGREATKSIGRKLRKEMKVKYMLLPKGKDPAGCSKSEWEAQIRSIKDVPSA